MWRIASLLVLALWLPATSTARDDPPAEALLADLPFHPDTPAKRIAIDLAPEGNRRRLPLMLDTGATNTVVTPRVARALGISIRSLRNRPYRRRTLLGHDLRIWVDACRSDTGATGGGFEYGLLGGDFLGHYVPELGVRFYDPD